MAGQDQAFDGIVAEEGWLETGLNSGSPRRERPLDAGDERTDPSDGFESADPEQPPRAKAPADPRRPSDTYAIAMREVPLLTREQEGQLGQTIRDSRLEMTNALAGLPTAWAVAADWAAQLLDGQRPLTDVFFAPFDVCRPAGSTGGATDESRSWRDVARDLSSGYAQSVKLGRRLENNAARDRLQHAFSSVQPGFPLLLAALQACRRLDRQVATIEKGNRTFHADLLTVTGESGQQATDRRTGATGDTPAPRRAHASAEPQNGAAIDSAREALMAIADEARTDLVTLRECCRRAEKAKRAYLDARGRMVNANLRLAHQMAYRMIGNGVDIDDLVQEAILGLMRAVDKFDHRLGYKFSTYATTWIRQTTSRSIAESSRTIRVATHMHDKILHLRRLARQIEQRQGRAPTVAELARASGIEPSQIEATLRTTLSPLSLDAPRPDLEEATLHGSLADSAQPDLAETADATRQAARLERFLAELDHRDALLLRLRHGIGTPDTHSLEEIGARLGVSRERVRQLEVRALARLRDLLSMPHEGLEEGSTA